jgi:hypothetical protein
MGMILHDWNLEKEEEADPEGVRGTAARWCFHRD